MVRQFAWPAKSYYNKPDGSLALGAYGLVFGDQAEPCLFGADGKLWAEDEEMNYNWAAVQHIYCMLHDQPKPADLPGATPAEGSGTVSWGTPV